jgi:hypothetical protein
VRKRAYHPQRAGIVRVKGKGLGHDNAHVVVQQAMGEGSRVPQSLLKREKERWNIVIQLILLSRVHAENTEARGPHGARLRGGVQTRRIAVRLDAEGAAQETRARKHAAVDCCAVCFRALVPCAVGLLCRPTSRTALNSVESSDSSAPLRSLREP